jgi:hypothetical protein
MKVQYYTKSQFYESFETDENSVIDISSVKLVDENSVLVKKYWPQAERVRQKGSSIAKCTIMDPHRKINPGSRIVYEVSW